MTPQSFDQRTPPRDRRLGIKHNLSPNRKRELAIKRRLWKIEQEELRRYELLRKEHIERWKREKMSQRKSRDDSKGRRSRLRDSRSSSGSQSPEPLQVTSRETHPREIAPVDPMVVKETLDSLKTGFQKIVDMCVSQTQQGLGSSTAHLSQPKTERRETSASTSRHEPRPKQSSGQDKKDTRPSRPRSPERHSAKSLRRGSRSSRRTRSRSRTRSPCRRCGHRYSCTCPKRCLRCDHYDCTCRQGSKQGGDYTHPSPEGHRKNSGRRQPTPPRRHTPPRTRDERADRSRDEAVRSRPEPSEPVPSTSQAAVQAAPTPQQPDVPRPRNPGVEWPPRPVTFMIRNQMIVTERGGPLHLWLLAYEAGDTVDPPPVDIPFLRDGWCMPRGNLADYLPDNRSVWVPLPLPYRPPPYFPNQRGLRPPRPPYSNWRR